MELVMQKKNGLMCYHVIFAEYKRRWIDTVSAARLRVFSNFLFCVSTLSLLLRSLRIDILEN